MSGTNIISGFEITNNLRITDDNLVVQTNGSNSEGASLDITGDLRIGSINSINSNELIISNQNIAGLKLESKTSSSSITKTEIKNNQGVLEFDISGSDEAVKYLFDISDNLGVGFSVSKTDDNRVGLVLGSTTNDLSSLKRVELNKYANPNIFYNYNSNLNNRYLGFAGTNIRFHTTNDINDLSLNDIRVAMTIDNSGNMGIGTNTPGIALNVQGNDGIKLPSGTTAQRPTLTSNLTDISGVIRYNTDLSKCEIYNESWVSLADSTSLDGTTRMIGTNNQMECKVSDSTKMLIKSDGTIDLSGNVTVQNAINDGIIFTVDGSSNFIGNSTLHKKVWIREGLSIGHDGILNITSYNYGSLVPGHDQTYTDYPESVLLQTTIDGWNLLGGSGSPGTIRSNLDPRGLSGYSSSMEADNRNILALQPYFGRVGIGVINAQYKLDISGGVLSIKSSGSLGSNQLVINAGNHDNGVDIEAFDFDTPTSKKHICLNAYGGNVGIGTDNPSYKLDVFGSIGLYGNDGTASPENFNNFTLPNIYLDCKTGGDYSGSNGIVWKTRDANYSKFSAKIVFEPDGSYYNGGLTFYTSNSSDSTTNAVERMTIDKNGNVGIGTDSPDSKLHILSTQASNGDPAFISRSQENDNTYFSEFKQRAMFASGPLFHFKLNEYNENQLTEMAGKPGLLVEGRQSSDFFCINQNGNIGIGINPVEKLHVNGKVRIELDPPSSTSDSNSTDCLQIISAFSGGNKESGGFKFQHSDTSTGTHILPKLRIFPVQITGTQWSQTGITFKTTSSSNMNVGIGTSNPGYPLEVGTGINNTFSGTYSTFKYNDASLGNGLLQTSLTNSTSAVSIKTQQMIWAQGGGFIASSDLRIKENVIDVSDNKALTQLRDISAVYYEYKDKVNLGFGTTIGFIAQQVKEHMPMAVSIQKQIIPNEMINIENPQWTTLTDSSGNNTFKLTINDLSDNSGNILYRFYVSNDSSANDECKKEIYSLLDDPKSFVFNEQWTNVFLYGKEVNDFHTLDKQKLFALNFSATQEIDRIQQEEKTKLEEANQKIVELETKNQELENQNNTISSKIVELENKNQELENKNQELENKNNTISTKISTLENKNNVLTSKIADLENQMYEIKQLLAAANN